MTVSRAQSEDRSEAESIEDIILENDMRGVSELRSHLPPDFCTQAAQHIQDNPGDVVIVTGFYILSAGQHETDGPLFHGVNKHRFQHGREQLPPL